MLTKLFRVLGIILIVLFSAFCIFVSYQGREGQIGEKKTLKVLSYPNYFESRFYDFRSNLTRNPDSFDDRIVLGKIDDYSIQNIGRFPWSRSVWTNVIKKLDTFGAKIVPFDVFFPEPEEPCGCGESSPDEDFAAAITKFQETPGNKVIFGVSMTPQKNFTKEDLVKHANIFEEIPDVMYNFVLNSKTDQADLLPTFFSKDAFPIPVLANTEAGIGHVQTTADTDGLYRHYPLLSNVEQIYFPSLALLTYQLYTGNDPEILLSQVNSTIQIETGSVHLNINGETKVRWLGNEYAFPDFAIYDLLQANDNDQKWHKLLKGKIIFLGSTAFGAHDLRHTPIDSKMPGVYFHMNMVNQLLDGNFFKKSEQSTYASYLILLIGTLLIIIVQLFGNALFDVISMLLIVSGAFVIDTYYLIPQGYNNKLFFTLFAIIGVYLFNTLLNFYFANKDKQFLKNAFGNYISPELIDEMYSSGEAPKLGGDSGIRTAYFTDIQSFSTFSEQLSATRLVELLNEYLSAMTDILLEHGGTLDKYEGDAIIAFFGAPLPQEDHATKACIVAAEMQSALLVLRKKWVSEGDKWPQIVHDMRMRIGINSGEIVTGNMGSSMRMNYTMMGDSVNLAARLEESAKQYGIFTHVSKESKMMADPDDSLFLWRELDTVRVVGKSEPVTTFELLGKIDEVDDNLKQLVTAFSAGLTAYKEQKWDEALANFQTSLECEYKRFPELKGKKSNPSEKYIERCNGYKEVPPPPDWDGVFTLTEK